MTPMDRAELERGRASDPLVRASALHHLVIETPDLDAAERFWGDFGLAPSARAEGAVYLRATGTAHHVIKLVRGPRGRLAAVAVSVGGELELRKLASLPDASPIEPTEEPGGGLRVRLCAPGGFVVHAVHGIAEVAPLPPRQPLARNVFGRGDRVGQPVRLPASPSQVSRIGHAALETTQPVALVLWLLRTLGMIISDYQPLEGGPSGLPVLTFLRCDRGSTPADHHTLAVALGPTPGLAHAAFEVGDLDEIGRGAEWLGTRGYRRAWGIGRHILGSQIFDYWRAPDGILAEHYADGDLLDASAPTGRLPFRGSHLAQWGFRPALGFALPPISLDAVVGSVRALAASEVSLPFMARALRALMR